MRPMSAEMQTPVGPPLARRLAYPDTPRVDHVDVWHGVAVPDPYRWLEDLDSEQTQAWVAAQNRITGEYLRSIPERPEIRQRLAQLWNFERFGIPVQHGGRYFFTKNDGLQDQSVLYVLDRLGGEPRVLIDPNGMSDDGTVALTLFNVSEDGRRVAYGLAHAGSDWQEWRVRDVETGEDLADLLRWVKFSQSAWTHDGAGFFYCRYDEPREDRRLEEANFWQKLYYHRLGTPQEEDELVYDRPDDKEMGFIPYVSEDGRHLIIHAWKGTEDENSILYRDLREPGSPVRELPGAFDASYTFVGSQGSTVWLLTDLDAPRGRLLAVDLQDPAPERWRELIPEGKETLQAVTCVGERLIAVYLKDATSQVGLYGLDGCRLGELKLPGIGTVAGFAGRCGDRETFFSFSSYTAPDTIYHYDLGSGEISVFGRPEVDFEPSELETHQVFYESKDGTRVPMFLTYRRGLEPDARTPVYLYGYGGFSTPMTPCFSVPSLVWIERGGIYAVANLRGGGEYGEDWHQAGARLRKQNTFDDLAAAAEWLIASGYTSRQHLAVGGHSNGGLVAAATVIQRPDLFRAALVGVGVLDMLRFHKFTIGWGWVSDYGSPENPEEFAVLYSYSPYHNVRPGVEYPAVLIVTADHDDRVVPVHSYKFASALQHAQAGPAPVLIRVQTRAGHGSGKPVSKQIEEASDELSFLWSELTAE